MNCTIRFGVVLLPLVVGCYVKSEPEPTPQRSSASGSVSGNPVGSSGGGTSSGGTTGASGNGSGGSSGGGTGTGTGMGTTTTTGLRVFVTSTVYSGNLGGAAGADAHCQTVADAKALGGTWVAWVSDGQTSPSTRITTQGPWQNLVGVEVFKNHANMLTVPESFLLDESGAHPQWLGYASPRTGVNEEAKPTGSDCSGWTSAAATSSSTTSSGQQDQYWGGGAGPVACDSKAPLICFEN